MDRAEKKIEVERAEKNRKNVRPKCIVIYGPDGKLVNSVGVYENGEKKIKTETELQGEKTILAILKKFTSLRYIPHLFC